MSAPVTRYLSSHELFRAASAAAEKAFPILREAGIPEGEIGGFACFLKTDRPGTLSSTPILVPPLGTVADSALAAMRHSQAQQKAWRLLENSADVSSFQSREASDEGTFAGAIRADNYIFAFDGPFEFVDEAMMLVAAIQTRALTRQDAGRIALISRNPYFSQML